MSFLVPTEAEKIYQYLDLKLLMAMSHYVSAGNWIWVIDKSINCS